MRAHVLLLPLSLLGVLVGVFYGSQAEAVLCATPSWSGVVNAPLKIPDNGVLVVGSVNQDGSLRRTSGFGLESVTPANGEPISGTTSVFSVPVGNTEQAVQLWTPDESWALGTYTAVGIVLYATDPPVADFEVVAAADDLELGALDVGQIELSRVETIAASIPCGFSVQGMTSSITTEYGIAPRVTVELLSDAPAEVVSQHLFAAYDAEAVTFSYVPVDLSRADGTMSVSYAQGQSSYCVVASAVSVLSQQVTTLEPHCIDDDGTDWTLTVPATTEQLDEQLMDCYDPPPELLPRFCALWAQDGVARGECASFTQDELDEALGQPIDTTPPDMTATPVDEQEPAPGASTATPPEPDPAPGGTSPEPDPAPGGTSPAAAGPGPRDVAIDSSPEPDPAGPADDDAPGTEAEPDDTDGPDVAAVFDGGAGDGATQGATAVDDTKLDRANAGTDGGCSVGPAQRAFGSGLYALALLLVAALLPLHRRRRGGHG